MCAEDTVANDSGQRKSAKGQVHLQEGRQLQSCSPYTPSDVDLNAYLLPDVCVESLDAFVVKAVNP